MKKELRPLSEITLENITGGEMDAFEAGAMAAVPILGRTLCTNKEVQTAMNSDPKQAALGGLLTDGIVALVGLGVTIEAWISGFYNGKQKVIQKAVLRKLGF